MKITPTHRIGHLTVTSDTGLRKNKYIIWNCTCDCGGTIQLDTRAIQRGLICDCGCETKVKPGQKDITGQRFGRLLAVSPTVERTQGGSVVWLCKCDCGSKVNVPLIMLQNGYKKSCGCLRNTGVSIKSGQRFGSLTVLESAPKRNHMLYWNCLCSCGKTAVVRQSYLLNGKTTSCGCLKKEKFREMMGFVDGTSVKLIENTANRLGDNNTSGYNGIYFNRKNQKWIAQITFKKKTHYLGSYLKIEDAVAARKAAEQRMYGAFLQRYDDQQRKVLHEKEK